MISTNIQYELRRTIVLILIFIVCILLNNLFILNKIEQERTARILELEEQMKNLQTRINLNALEIKNTGQ